MITLKKSLGQNLLINPHIIDRIIATAEITKDDIILEVGPGTGILTQKLAEKSKEVLAIEKDRRLIPTLREKFEKIANVKIIEEDILSWAPEALLRERLRLTSGFPKQGFGKNWENYKVVANIPYYITSNFLRVVFERWPKPELIVLTIQKEVAQRIMAKPAHMNLLALSVQYYAIPEIIGYISKNNFRPVPKVDSAIIKLVPQPTTHDTEYTHQLFSLIRIGFSEKRKQLIPLLAKGLKIDREKVAESLKQADLNPTTRAENLNLGQWIIIKNYLKS